MPEVAPTFPLAATMLVIRSFLAYIDTPLKSSFIMGMVQAEERGSAAGGRGTKVEGFKGSRVEELKG